MCYPGSESRDQSHGGGQYVRRHTSHPCDPRDTPVPCVSVAPSGHTCPTRVTLAPSHGWCHQPQPGHGGPAQPRCPCPPWGVTAHLQLCHPCQLEAPGSCLQPGILPRSWDPAQSSCPGHPSCSPCSPQLVLAEVVDVQGLPSLTEDLLLLFSLRLLLPTLFL